jgi:hypothetical protein
VTALVTELVLELELVLVTELVTVPELALELVPVRHKLPDQAMQ